MAYNKKIEIQLLTEAEDEQGIGQSIQVWEAVFEPWAEINCIGGREYYAAVQTNSENDMIFKIRYTKLLKGKLTSEVRIRYDDIIYDVIHLDDRMEQHREWVIRTRQLNGEVQT